MERHSIAPREGWRAIVEAQGLIWHSDGAEPYWDESACYSFTAAEIDTIEEAVEELHRLFIEAGNFIMSDLAMLELFGIPDWCREAVRDAWETDPPSLNYGRFDLGYTGDGPPKLFEYNCDTPTAMLEAAVVQWDWKEQVFPDEDQFTSLHDKLIARWAELRPELPGQRLWFTHMADPSHEDAITTTYMRDLAAEAGLETHAVLIDDIGIDRQGRIVDQGDQLISAVFKLYPWEWIVSEDYGRDIVRHLDRTIWIEPIWKMIWSNKAILKVLWSLFPGHPNLLAAALRPEEIGPDHVAKPFLAREGANIRIMQDGSVVAESQGGYRDGLTLYQQLYPLRDFGRGYPVLGCWAVNGAAAGMGIREDGLITGNRARFVPHIIKG
jgi:glutathionylspermidine synthase